MFHTISFLRSVSFSKSIPMFTLLAFCIVSGKPLTGAVVAGPIESVSRSSQETESGDQPEVDEKTRLNLHKRLCELNQNWGDRSPDFSVLPLPLSFDDEVSLIQIHLTLVINELRSSDVTHLSPTQRQNRARHLQTLQVYLTDGSFPQNVYAAQRRPVFIDPWGTHCAVGYLIATSGHSRLALTINKQHQLDYIRDIKTEGLAQWQHDSGLSQEELALIQPTYRSTSLEYPAEIEELILGNSDPIIAGIESGTLKPNTRCAGKTLLHFAAAVGDLDLVKLLVEKGADPHALSTEGFSKGQLSKGGSHTIVKARWDQPTAVRARGGMGIGLHGNVFKTRRGQIIAATLNDLRGGQAGLNALDFATEKLLWNTFYGGRFIGKIRFHPGINVSVVKGSRKPVSGSSARPKDELLDTLNKNRAAVAAWLESRGVTKVATSD